MKFYLGEIPHLGIPKACCDTDGYEEYCDWVLSDLQCEDSVDLILNHISFVEMGRLKEILSDGNAWVATINVNGITLKNLDTDRKSQKVLSLKQAKELLSLWRRSLPD